MDSRDIGCVHLTRALLVFEVAADREDEQGEAERAKGGTDADACFCGGAETWRWDRGGRNYVGGELGSK